RQRPFRNGACDHHGSDFGADRPDPFARGPQGSQARFGTDRPCLDRLGDVILLPRIGRRVDVTGPRRDKEPGMKWIVLWGLPVLYLLHQDAWLWDRDDLVFGFLPVGLAYHVAYTLLVFVWMSLLVRFAWPEELTDAVE